MNDELIIARHETGHLLSLYICGIIDELKSIDIIKKDYEGKLVLGLTEITTDHLKAYSSELSTISNALQMNSIRLAEIAHQRESDPFNNELSETFNENMKLYNANNEKYEQLKDINYLSSLLLPYVSFFFGGGAIDNINGAASEARTSIDMKYLTDTLKNYVPNFKPDSIKSRIYAFLKTVYPLYSSLFEVIVEKLLERKILYKNNIDSIINVWESHNNIKEIQEKTQEEYTPLLDEFTEWLKKNKS